MIVRYFTAEIKDNSDSRGKNGPEPSQLTFDAWEHRLMGTAAQSSIVLPGVGMTLEFG
jgi:hypothetical protein